MNGGSQFPRCESIVGPHSAGLKAHVFYPATHSEASARTMKMFAVSISCRAARPCRSPVQRT